MRGEKWVERVLALVLGILITETRRERGYSDGEADVLGIVSTGRKILAASRTVLGNLANEGLGNYAGQTYLCSIDLNELGLASLPTDVTDDRLEILAVAFRISCH